MHKVVTLDQVKVKSNVRGTPRTLEEKLEDALASRRATSTRKQRALNLTNEEYRVIIDLAEKLELSKQEVMRTLLVIGADLVEKKLAQ